jgi:hypothetical protein
VFVFLRGRGLHTGTSTRAVRLLLVFLVAGQVLVCLSAQAQASSSTSNLNLGCRRVLRPYVFTYGSNGDLRSDFSVGEKVGIKAYLYIFYDVKVFDPNNRLVYQSRHLFGRFDSGLLDNLTTIAGAWRIQVGSLIFGWMHVGARFFVVPDSPLGPLGVMGVFFGAFGVASVLTKKKRSD